jgi:hypothetical protein
MVVNVATQQALVPEGRRLFAITIAVDAVQHPGDFLRDHIGFSRLRVIKHVRVESRPCFPPPQGVVFPRRKTLLGAFRSHPQEHHSESNANTSGETSLYAHHYLVGNPNFRDNLTGKDENEMNKE